MSFRSFAAAVPTPAVLRWIERIPHDQLFLSVVTIGEIQAGIEITREQDLEKAIEIETCLVELMDSHNVLPMDGPTFREWARLRHRRSNTLAADAMIAATAIVNELVVATRNVRDFEQSNVELLNPFVSHRTYAVGTVIPAKAGIQCPKSLIVVPILSRCDFWTPAFAGVTGVGSQLRNS